ncbi:hypothetical protein G7L40_20510 [Paenibacillus polymyxa]|uniref:Uncharacterized protein n=1 Tax=Paenibacillus polymyxa TaxID=1406 RepID=A0A378Y1H9_PAEPO|nr:hypothetical protein [Paenibacillus polymyxa]MBE7896127.1 hypothetical protein [Paenibacillus polymyxa]MBG9765927.1 hypothetical protein [Paenibacillus polymyxa]MCC3256657.1 hypothetical protein [Paenibacillus polymyxa]QPK54852.1 hypothetical protein G7035_20555 [Paenibacillus polymyxa]QPK59942.1 hypothetical protein G7L40_20510 [Paenibacillus polymyxa]
MNEQRYDIQLVSTNQHSEFYFYTTREELQEYLEETLKISVNEFLQAYNPQQSRNFLEWIKSRYSRGTKNES